MLYVCVTHGYFDRLQHSTRKAGGSDSFHFSEAEKEHFEKSARGHTSLMNYSNNFQ